MAALPAQTHFPADACPGSAFASLQNVSCPSKAGCWAVGESFKGSVSTPLIDRWNGKSWSLAAS
jgi:hypothetical protein